MTAVETLTGAPSAWDSVDWNRVNKQVYRLQVRIAKATREGRFNKAKALQRLLTRSFYGKLTAVKRVTSNTGAKTPGVDKEVWNTSTRKWKAVLELKHRGYRTLPLRRIYIPKANGKLRPLSIPVMKCRAMQALHLLALEPVSETLADPHSYGFRPKRQVADAIVECFRLLCMRKSVEWILEADIESCFDKISHDWLLSHIPMETKILRKWLKAGYIDDNTLYMTEEGTPQGGIISPALLVMTLSGLQHALKRKAAYWKDLVNVVVYADDFIVTARTKEILEQKVKPALTAFLSERGLKLSEQKTHITHVTEGFDFLGFTIRKFGRTLLIRPSKTAIKRFLQNVRQTIKSSIAVKTESLVRTLNPKIVGWTNFHSFVCAKRAFRTVEHQIFWCLYRWAKRRHPKKRAKWRKKKYFTTIGARQWVFFATAKRGRFAGQPLYLRLPSNTPIVRHIKIRAKANPYSPADYEYFLMLSRMRKEKKLKGGNPRKLYRREVQSPDRSERMVPRET